MAREGLFNVLQHTISFEGIRALELFGGTGGVTYELASRGAAQVTIVEQHAASVAFIKKTLLEFKMNGVNVIRGDVFGFLKTATMAYDFIFADPPYALPLLPQLPNIIIERTLLSPGGMFVLEHDGKHGFEGHPHFIKAKKYGDTFFSFFE